MDPNTGQVLCRVGDEVYGSDDHKIGTVAAFDANFLTVEHGLLRKSQFYIPMAAVNACADGKVYLNATKSDVSSRGWDQPPPLATDADGAIAQ